MNSQTPERKVKNQINKQIKLYQNLGIKIYGESRVAAGVNYKKGTPDMWIVLNGKHIELEIKREEGGVLSTSQIQWQKYFDNLSISHYVISNLADFINIIEKELAK